jgi:hypothetical protein
VNFKSKYFLALATVIIVYALYWLAAQLTNIASPPSAVDGRVTANKHFTKSHSDEEGEGDESPPPAIPEDAGIMHIR